MLKLLLAIFLFWSGNALAIGVPIGSTSIDDSEILPRSGHGHCDDGYEAVGDKCHPKPPPCDYDCYKQCKIKLIKRYWQDKVYSYYDAKKICSKAAKAFGVNFYESDCNYDYHKKTVMWWYPWKKYDGSNFVQAHIEIANHLYDNMNPKYHYETEYRYWYCGGKDHY